MSARRILPGLIIVLVLTLTLAGYFYLRKVNTPVSAAIEAMPDDPIFILRFEDAPSFWKKIKQSSIIWEDMLGAGIIGKLDSDISALDSLLFTDKEISKLLESSEIFISCYATGKEQIDFLYVSGMPDITSESAIHDFIRNRFGKLNGASKPVQAYTLYSYSIPGGRKFNYTVAKGVFISGFNALLVERAINVLDSKKSSLKNNASFVKVRESTGNHVSVGIYLHYGNLARFTKGLLSEKMQTDVENWRTFASWSGLDATLRPNEIVLNGFTTAEGKGKSYLGLFSEQKPAKIEVTRIVPDNAFSLLFMGFSNFSAFNESYKNFLSINGKREKYEEEITTINSTHNTDIEREMMSWIENEVALIQTSPENNEKDPASYIVFRSNRIEEASSSLLTLQKKTTKKTEGLPDTSIYKGYYTGKIAIPSLFEKILGNDFSIVKQNYFTILSNYVVFADSIKYLQRIVDKFLEGKTLFFNQQYQSFIENNLQEEANLFFYRNIQNSTSGIQDLFSTPFASEIKKHEGLINKFQSLAIQFSSDDKLFYTTMLLKHAPAEKQESNTLWEIALDTTLSSTPQIVLNHKTGAKEIIIQDDANTIYLISNTGKILWKKELNEKIMGTIFQVDALRNDKLQLLFNTESEIHLIDRNGKTLNGFPVKVPSKAMAQLTVLDYENNKDYRILLPAKDRKVYNYAITGKIIKGWSFEKTEDVVINPIQHCVVANKDYLIFADISGKVYITDRQGKARISLTEKFISPSGELFFEGGKDLSMTRLVMIDSLGNIQKLSLDDRLETFKIEVFDSIPFFTYKDLDNDGQREYIFTDGKMLTVYKNDESLLMNYEFENPVKNPPIYFHFPDNKGYLGVTSKTSNEIFLLNNKGVLMEKFPLYGSTSFCIADMNTDNHLVLITGGAKGNILAYEIK